MKKGLPVSFTRFEIGLWCASVLAVLLSFLLSPLRDPFSLAASLIGVTALILLAKGRVAGQIFVILFAMLYGIVSFRVAYYGEMITYLGMSAPMALASAISWLRHPHGGSREVAVAHLSCRTLLRLLLLTLLVTVFFYFILGMLDTSRLAVSTLSVATSFYAASLTFLRSPFYALAYAVNDIVLILLWAMALGSDPASLSMILCFLAFLANDLYGYVSWRRLEEKQRYDTP